MAASRKGEPGYEKLLHNCPFSGGRDLPYASHYLWVIFAVQVIAAVFLLVNRYVPLAVAVLAPVIVNILVFHALMAPSGLPLALVVAVLWTMIFAGVRPAFAGLFQPRSQAQA
jgi:putative oxidoreductase